MPEIKKYIKRYYPYAVFAAITFAIMLPFFFQEGFLFLLDMVWGPNILPSEYFYDGGTSSYPLMLLINIFSLFLPREYLQKILLALVLYLCGHLMFKLSRDIMPRRWATLSGIFYILNPYVFERFLAGQWIVLLGYAIFPLVVFRFTTFLKSDRRKDLWFFVVLFSAYPLISLHWAYISFWFLSLMGGIYLIQIIGTAKSKKQDLTTLRKKFISFAILQLVIWLTINFFWLKDFWNADGVISKITQNDFQAFSTTADSTWGTFFNVLSLYGFWQDSFFLPKDFFSGWWVLTFIIIVFSAFGFYDLAKKRNSLALTLGVAFVPTVLIAAGYGDTLTRPLTDFLFQILPGFAGLRETAKVVGILAFTYALFFPLGVRLLIDRLYRNTKNRNREIIYTCSAVLFILSCCLLVNNIFSGFNGQVRAWPYPDSWYKVKETLDSEPGTRKVLFLPWHRYLEIAFANNVRADNPASAFFGAEIISGENLDSLYLADKSQGEWDERISEMVKGEKCLDDNFDFLKAQKVEYIILAKTDDWQMYSFLDKSWSVRKIFEENEIALYEIL